MHRWNHLSSSAHKFSTPNTATRDRLIPILGNLIKPYFASDRPETHCKYRQQDKTKISEGSCSWSTNFSYRRRNISNRPAAPDSWLLISHYCQQRLDNTPGDLSEFYFIFHMKWVLFHISFEMSFISYFTWKFYVVSKDFDNLQALKRVWWLTEPDFCRKLAQQIDGILFAVTTEGVTVAQQLFADNEENFLAA